MTGDGRSVVVRDMGDGDRDTVLALNAGDVEHLSSLDGARLDWIVSLARLAVVAEIGGEVAAFALVVGPGTAYDSANYRWFGDRLADFSYLDRIVVAGPFRRRGLAGLLYDRAEADGAGSGILVCEVNVEPANEPSLAFHQGRGYRELGRRVAGDGTGLVMLGLTLGVGAGPTATD